MTHDDDFDPTLEPEERAELAALGERLLASRPVPAAAFRGDLRRRLVAQPPPRRLRLRALSCLASGATLLMLAALGTMDAGPLAPQELLEASAQLSESVRALL